MPKARRSGPLSASTVLFDGYPLDLAFNEIAAAGLKFVEPAFIAGYVDFDESAFTERAAAALDRAIRAAGLSCVAVSAHHDLGAADAPDLTVPRLRFAHALGAKLLVTNATTAARRDALLRNLETVIPICEETGVVLALENPGHGEGAAIGCAADGVRLVEQIGSPYIRLNYDVGNILTYSRERLRPELDFETALPAVAHVHFKDIRPSVDGWRFTAIGDGAIDYRALWQTLVRAEPDLPIGLELPLRLSRPDWGDPKRAAAPLPLEALRAALRRSLDFLACVEGGI